MTHEAAPIHVLVPGPLDRRTGGTIYDRHIVDGLADLGRVVEAHEIPGQLPEADEVARRTAAEILTSIADRATVVIDGLAMPACEDSLAAAHDRLCLVALCHHPLADETGLRPAVRDDLRRREAAAFAHMHGIIVTSKHTARMLADYGVDEATVSVVLPGLDPAPGEPAAPRWKIGRPAQLLCVANLIPRKGHAVLIEALAMLADLDWRLTCVGSEVLDPANARSVQAAAAEKGIADRVTFAGTVPNRALLRPYRDADLFVLPSYYEGYGMAFAEAMRHALPIVAAAGGAVPETVPPDAGLLVPPGDASALAAALRKVLGDPDLYRTLSAGAVAAASNLRDWAAAAARFAEALDKVAQS